MPSARLSDIAQALGLNIATVSRALRNDLRIKQDTRDRIRAEADRLGYRPHWGARALAEGRSRTIWFLVPGLDTPIERDPATWAGRWLLDRGYDLLVAQHYGDPVIYGRLLDRLAFGGADGAIVVPGSRTASESESDRALAEKAFPFVYLDRRVPGIPVPVVTTDNRAAAALLVDRLVDAGRQDGVPLAWIADRFRPDLNSVEAERSAGVREAAARWGLPVNPFQTGAKGLQPGAWIATSASQIPDFGSPIQEGCRAGVFDAWEGRGSRSFPVLVAKQNFRSLGEEAARILLEGLDGTVRGGEFRYPLLAIEAYPRS